MGNFDHVLEEAFQRAYLPFVQHLFTHPPIHINLHYSGSLLEWLERRHPEYFELLRQLITRGQVELIGGGYFEPILPSIPDGDKVAQIRRLTDYLRDRFGVKARGAWIAERVWEPSLARPLAEAGVEYTILDDTHFLAAGLDTSQLRGTYLTEEVGAQVRLVPSLKALRYAIPFREPEETLRVLREGTDQTGALFAMGDDCEKFGVWPGTYEHCYTNGWLDKFFRALEGAREWLKTATLSDFLAKHPPIGRIYLPTASYAEMMEWALPFAASGEFKACREEAERMPQSGRFLRFLRGGLWRNFLSKYPESNQIHKLMLQVSQRWHKASATVTPQTESANLLKQAHTHLLASQCNDAYWHGIFGGLYAPHLRSALLRHLIQAESLLDKIDGATKSTALHTATEDFDADGQEEVLIQHPTFGAVLRPGDGGTISSLRFKPADTEVINSLMRRPEAYHDSVRHQVITQKPPSEGLASIHERALSKESNLDKMLRYDSYNRHSFRTYVFPAAKQWKDFDGSSLEEHRDLANGAWNLVPQEDPATFHLRREALVRSNGQDLRIEAVKMLSMRAANTGWEINCRSSLAANRTSSGPLALGIELVLNLLAPDAPDRYLLANEVRRPLEFRGEIDAPHLVLVDQWQRVKIALTPHPLARWWIVPIETISQSEAGFERVYQGSAIMPVWRIGPGWRDVTCVLRVEIANLSE